MVTHSSILAWRIPWHRGALQATVRRQQRVGHNYLFVWNTLKVYKIILHTLSEPVLTTVW